MPNTPNLDLEKPSTGDYEDAWGPVVNSNMDKIDAHASAANHATAISGAVTTHENASNPHPTYETSAEAAQKITDHEAASNPHPTYETAAEAAAQIATHEAASNPHPTYLTAAEGDADYVELAGDTMTGELVVPDLSVSGLTGATSGARFVGATSSGAPTSGTFSIGDWIVDRGGNMWVCTVAGSPGTWLSVGSGREVGYSQITSIFQKPTAGSGAEDVTGLSLSNIVIGSRPVMLHFWCSHVVTDTNNATGATQITDSSNTVIASTGNWPMVNPSTSVGGQVHHEIWARVNPAAGTYTYKVRINTTTGGSKPSIVAAATAPAFLRAIEV